MTSEMISIVDRIKDNGITMKVSRVDSNPAMSDFNGDHWKCVIRMGKKRMTLIFSQGYAYKGAEPELENVLDCLLSDASILENAPNFEDYCNEFGYDSDSRKAEKGFKALERQVLKLQNFLGEKYEEFVFNTERM
jgi:hypothetical protein